MQEWVEQQLAGAWEVRAIVADVTWTRMASHATSAHSGLRLSQPVSTFSPKTSAVVTVPSSPIRDSPVCTR